MARDVGGGGKIVGSYTGDFTITLSPQLRRDVKTQSHILSTRNCLLANLFEEGSDGILEPTEHTKMEDLSRTGPKYTTVRVRSESNVVKRVGKQVLRLTLQNIKTPASDKTIDI